MTFNDTSVIVGLKLRIHDNEFIFKWRFKVGENNINMIDK